VASTIRKEGIAEADPITYSSGVSLTGYAAIAAPVFDAGQHLRYVLTLVYQSNSKRKEELARLTRQAADQASQLAGADISA